MHLTTPRLIVRPVTPDDVEAARAWLSDPEVMEHVESPMNRARVADFLHTAGIEKELVHAVALRETGELVGHLIFHEWVRPGVWEIGWVLRRDVWRRDYARELTEHVLAHARTRPGIRTVLAETVRANTAAIATIEACGLVRSPELDDPDDGLLTWAIDLG